MKSCVKTLLYLTVTLLLAAQAATVHATVVMELTLEELVQQSALIFTGEVLAVDVTTVNELVYSTVTFAVETTVKGQVEDQAAEPQLQLRFLGGEAGELKVEVAGQQIPVVGDRGLYFISDPLGSQVNPITGWSQGWFPLRTAEDGIAYLDLRNHQDYALVLGYPDPLAQKMQALGFSRAEIEARVPGSLEFPLDDFVAAIAQVMQEQGD